MGTGHKGVGAAMRLALMLSVGFLLCASSASAAPGDEFAKLLPGPWGRVDFNWKPSTGVLAKNSCPLTGVSSKERIGLFGDGGTMWIEPGLGGKLSLYDG